MNARRARILTASEAVSNSQLERLMQVAKVSGRAHQNVAEQTANDYTTSLTGLKVRIAHKRAGSEKWSATPRSRRKRMISLLRSVLADLEKQTAR